jgi:N-acetyl-anhydromuramyl-L-alanine amidase AmpD
MMIDLNTIPFEPSPNCRLGHGEYKYLIIHSMQGYFKGTISWFKNPKSVVSAHYLISQQGNIMQMVHEKDTAYHCYMVNRNSLGIELEDLREGETNPKWVSDAMLYKAAELAAALCVKYNIDVKNILGHDTPWIQQLSTKYRHIDPGIYFPWSKFRWLVDNEVQKIKKN